MKQARVFGIHPWFNSTENLIQFLHIEGLYPDDFFVWDEKNPEYLFASEWIYTDKHYAKKFKELSKRALIKIFWGGECVAPDLNVFDYAIVFNKKLSCMDRVASMPTDLFFKSAMYEPENNMTESEAKSRLQKLRFCNFIYSNSLAHPNRDKLFYAVSKYKRVESLGKHLNNVNTLITQGGGLAKVERKD